MAIQSYQELVAWQKAMDLVEAIYFETKKFPREEIYGLTAQLRRAAVSIPSNIAEGQGRNTTRDLLHFLSIAQGSLKEVETQVLIAERLKYISKQSASNTNRSNIRGGPFTNWSFKVPQEKNSVKISTHYPLLTTHYSLSP